MWLKLAFPLAGKVKKQENRWRERERERGETNSSQFTQEKGLLVHLCVLLTLWIHTHTHTHSGKIGTGDTTQQLQGEIKDYLCVNLVVKCP